MKEKSNKELMMDFMDCLMMMGIHCLTEEDEKAELKRAADLMYEILDRMEERAC